MLPQLQRNKYKCLEDSDSDNPELLTSMSGSSLKFFAKAKNSVTKVVSEFLQLLEESRDCACDVHHVDDLILTENDLNSLQNFADKTRGVLEILGRNSMKVAFFGRTSNGKSTVINAMLKNKILPSGIGHTTNCFVQIEGVDGTDAYIVTDDGERRSVQSLSHLASALSKVRLTSESLIKIFWPKHKCHLLQEDVTLMDSPGIDLSADVDRWIDKFCLDADVFVLVVNAESTLMQTEKNFFHRVSSRLSKPNIFILNNRWDASAYEIDTKKEVRQQHVDRSTSFLVDELQVLKPEDINKRVFFVSALETLQQNTAVSPVFESEGMDERLIEFVQFEGCFEDCISRAAVVTKFAQHVKNVESVANSLTVTWDEIIEKTSHMRDAKIKEFVDLQYQLEAIGDRFGHCKETMKRKIIETSNQLQIKMLQSLTKELRHLHGILDEYSRTFNPEDEQLMRLYKKDLNFYVEENLTKNLHVKHTPVARAMYLDTCQQMIDSACSMLPVSQNELFNILMPNRQFEIIYNLDCMGLCSEFIEDIEFQFSLGLTALIAKCLGKNKTEDCELEQILASSTSSSSLIPFTSGSTLGVLALLSVVTKAVGLRVVGMCMVVYTVLYVYERLTWTNKTKEQAFKRQYVAFVTHQLKTVLDFLSFNCSQQIERELNFLMKLICDMVVEHQDSLKKAIQESEASLNKMENICESAETFRTKFHNISKQLEEFRLTYLETSA